MAYKGGEEMTEKEYRQHPAISRSALWKIRESPEKFKWAMEHPDEPTPALVFGQAFHKVALEPDDFLSEFAVAPNVDRRTKEEKAVWDSFSNASAEKTVIDDKTFYKVLDMVEALNAAPFVGKLLNGEHEKPIFWVDEMTSEMCKARYDCLTEVNGKPVIVDLKTAANASTDAFMRGAVKYGYDFQAAMYSEGIKQTLGITPLFVFVVIEKDPPYAVNILQADEEFIQRGYDIFRELIGTYHECKETDNWWGYMGAYNVINNLGVPSWLKED